MSNIKITQVLKQPQKKYQSSKLVLDFDGTNYQVTDLGSTNGTFLSNIKLLPGTPKVWTPETALRVGKSWLRLERALAPQPTRTEVFLSDGAMVDPSLIHSSAGMGRVAIFTETAELSVDPGGSTTVTIYLPAGETVETYYKYGPTPSDATPHWYEFTYDGTTGAQIVGNVITLHFVDGLRGDDDLDNTNATVADIGAPAVAAAVQPGPDDDSGGGGGGGGCFIDATGFSLEWRH